MDMIFLFFFFFSSRRRHTRLQGDWSSDVCSSDLRETARREGCRCQITHPGGTVSTSPEDRKSVVKGKSVDLGGRRIIKKKKKRKKRKNKYIRIKKKKQIKIEQKI